MASVKREGIFTTPPTIKGRRLLDSNNRPVGIKRSPVKQSTPARSLFEEAANRRSPSFGGTLEEFDLELPPIDFDSARKYSIASGLTRQSGIGVMTGGGGGGGRRSTLLPRKQPTKPLATVAQPIEVLEEEQEADITPSNGVEDWVSDDALSGEDPFDEGPSLTLRDILLRVGSNESGPDDSLEFNFDMIREFPPSLGRPFDLSTLQRRKKVPISIRRSVGTDLYRWSFQTELLADPDYATELLRWARGYNQVEYLQSW